MECGTTVIKGDEYVPAAPEADKEPAAVKKGKKGAAKETAAAEPMKVDFDGIVERAVALPVEGGYARPLAAYDGALYYRSSDGVKKLSLSDLKTQDY